MLMECFLWREERGTSDADAGARAAYGGTAVQASKGRSFMLHFLDQGMLSFGEPRFCQVGLIFSNVAPKEEPLTKHAKMRNMEMSFLPPLMKLLISRTPGCY